MILSSISLNSVRKPIHKDLKRFEKEFKKVMYSSVSLVNLVARYIVRQKGKRVRPLLVFLSAKICGSIGESTYRAATLIEILHTATLVHDDVIDNADTRRGISSINAIWKNKVAVLMGDYLLSRGLLLSLEHNDYFFLNSICQAVKRMSEGELLQIQKSRQLDIDEPTYIKIVSDKTAALFSVCTEIGSASVTKDPGKIGLLKAYGENCGIAFQIRDDLMDYLGRKTIIGKPIYSDMKEKKLTLPLIYAIEYSERKDAKKALKCIKRKETSRKELKWLVDFVYENGGIDYSLKKAEEYASKAQACLISLPNSPAKNSMMQFARFCIERDK